MYQRISKFKTFSITLAIAGAFFVSSDLKAEAATNTKAAFTLKVDTQTFSIDEATLTSWKTPGKQVSTLSFAPEQNLENYMLEELGVRSKSNSHLNFSNYNVLAIYDYLKSIESQIDISPKDATFVADSNKVTDFDPGTDGKTLDLKNSTDAIVESLGSGKNEVALSVSTTSSTHDLASINKFGIKDLVSVGTSDFSGSPSNRIHNIKVGVEKERGTLIAPGEEFSFNKYLGPVDGEHGFLPELVIKASGTIPEFGGGLCQVSSTVFRAAMNAGLPITERRNHSYAVKYYAPQGTDATIYPGVVDLKFTNDTPGYLLVWPKIDGNILTFSFYGIKDNRKVSFDGPYSYDKKSDGSMKAVWTRTVTSEDGSTRTASFHSIYQPPALFHKTETFPPKTTTPPTTDGTNSAPVTTPEGTTNPPAPTGQTN
jgi:vancomycin resistance protein YoaR